MQLLCVGVRKAGVTAIAYVKNGRIVIQMLPPSKPPLTERVKSYG